MIIGDSKVVKNVRKSILPPRMLQRRSSLGIAKRESESSLGSITSTESLENAIGPTMAGKGDRFAPLRSSSGSSLLRRRNSIDVARPVLRGVPRTSSSSSSSSALNFSCSHLNTSMSNLGVTGIMKTPSIRNLIQRQESSSLVIPNRNELQKELGPGPMRFCPPAGEPTAREQIESLSLVQSMCFTNLKEKWMKRHIMDRSEEVESLLLMFARCSPGEEPFSQKMAWKVMKRFDKRFLNLTAVSMEEILLSKVVLPLPSCRTHQCQDVVFMRPSRFTPNPDNVNAILDPIAYVLMSLTTTKESASVDGLCFLMYMNEFKMSHFSADYMRHLLAILQGLKIPIRVNKVLLVNAPVWFDTVWNMMTAMMTHEFTTRVHRVKEEQLGEHLSGDFEVFLPDDMATGKADTTALVQDFVSYRKHVEKVTEIQPSRPSLERERSKKSVSFDPAFSQ